MAAGSHSIDVGRGRNPAVWQHRILRGFLRSILSFLRPFGAAARDKSNYSRPGLAERAVEDSLVPEEDPA